MSTLIANQAIEAAIAAILLSIAALIGAFANYWNTRSRILEQDRRIADLQRQTLHLETAQQIQAATSPGVQPPTIVTIPAAPAPPPPDG